MDNLPAQNLFVQIVKSDLGKQAVNSPILNSIEIDSIDDDDMACSKIQKLENPKSNQKLLKNFTDQSKTSNLDSLNNPQLILG